MASEIETIVQLAAKTFSTVPAQVIDLPDGRTFAIVRNDFGLTNITPANKAEVLKPKLISQNVRIQSAESLIEYTNTFKNQHTVIFADINNNSIHVAIDYHLPPDRDGNPKATLCKHNAYLNLPFSDEFQTWVAQDDRLIPHVAFATFLEENAADITEPGGGELYELIRDIQVKQDMHFSSSIRMGDAVSISYSKDEDATTKANMELPVLFYVSIPVYFSEESVELRCLMRRKIADGKLHLGFKILRLEEVRQNEFDRVVRVVSMATDRLTIYGAIGT